MRIVLLLLSAFAISYPSVAQKQNPVYIDGGGTMRWTATKKEAAFFGVNYTVPFAYGYRSHKALGINHEKAIDADVAHMARLGFDAFRVHVWDTEITDSAGNLLQNEHLRLFDYLIYKLKQQGIKILITPLAFWGNGYPEKDENTGSFSSIYDKQKVLIAEAAIKAQEAYLKQFFSHVNPYTKKLYGADEDVIAMEINNEPHHSGPKEGATAYINRMAAAVRSTGWTKPVFYNISESPLYADAVVKANVDGHSFQWYPTGLVSNRTLQGNYLPHVDRYHIPFDTIRAFKNRARMVYEADAGDVLSSYMYPAMARSFRGAGFQWATQFAYDPLYTAHANTEYQTHFVNLAYTPGKAISLMIAGKVFHQVPRFKSYGAFPADTLFENFRVSYREDLSEMNADTAFYYSNTTNTAPVNSKALQHVAGVGSSPVVRYEGTGAYFLDKIEEGVWRLEVLPDVFLLSDPFARASPKKPVARLIANNRLMQIDLPDLGNRFGYINTSGSQVVSDNSFVAKPGIYLLVRQGKEADQEILKRVFKEAPNDVYVLAAANTNSLIVNHQPDEYAVAGKDLTLKAFIAGVHDSDYIEVEARHTAGGGWQKLPMKLQSGFTYTATVPAGFLLPGRLDYRIFMHRKAGSSVTFPGAAQGDPYAWDALPAQLWQTTVLPHSAALVLFDAATDEGQLSIFTSDWKANTITYSAGMHPPYLHQQLSISKAANGPVLGWQLPAGEKLKQSGKSVDHFTKVVVNASTAAGQSGRLRLVLFTKEAQAFETIIDVNSDQKDYEVSLNQLAAAPLSLLPRPYPGFQPLFFTSIPESKLLVKDLDGLQVWVAANKNLKSVPVQIRLQSVILK